jgi:hypothetical protein
MGIYQNLKDNDPLDPGVEADKRLYEPLYKKDGYVTEDPVALLEKNIVWGATESLQLFSGFRGSGKTTELFRLRQRLRAQGYVVLYADGRDYLPQADPVDVAPFFLAVAAAFGDALSDGRHGNGYQLQSGDRSLLERLSRTLKTEIKPEKVELNLGVIKVSTALLDNPGFRNKLTDYFKNGLNSLRAEVVGYIQERIEAFHGGYTDERGKGIVFLFDNLEQIRGSYLNLTAVTESVTTLFTHHYPHMFELPGVHVVYTVPPWLKFSAQNTGQITLLPCVHLWKNDQGRAEDDAGYQVLGSLVRRRFTNKDATGFATCFEDDGADPRKIPPELRRLIDQCGGHFRDLLRLLRETILRAETLPISSATVGQAIAAVRSNFLPIAMDDAHWLQEIARHRTTALKSREPEDVQRLTLFLDTHFVLYFKNGKEWYDTHPLIRESVEEICEQFPRPAPAAPAAPPEAPV